MFFSFALLYFDMTIFRIRYCAIKNVIIIILVNLFFADATEPVGMRNN